MSFRNNDAEIFDRGLIKGAFLGFEKEVVFLKAGKDIMGQGMEKGEGCVEEKDIIKVDNEMAFIDKVREDGVHEGLEGSRGIAEAEGHDKGFEKA